MKKIVHCDMVRDVSPFPFKRTDIPTEEELRKYLFSADWFWDMTVSDYCMIMDYDGFVEFCNEHIPQWKEEEGDEFWDGYSAFEYLRDHVGITVDIVEEVPA